MIVTLRQHYCYIGSRVQVWTHHSRSSRKKRHNKPTNNTSDSARVWRWAGWRGTGLPNSSLETKFSGANADKEIFIFPVQLTTCRIGILARLIHTFAIGAINKQEAFGSFVFPRIVFIWYGWMLYPVQGGAVDGGGHPPRGDHKLPVLGLLAQRFWKLL